MIPKVSVSRQLLPGTDSCASTEFAYGKVDPHEAGKQGGHSSGGTGSSEGEGRGSDEVEPLTSRPVQQHWLACLPDRRGKLSHTLH